MSGAQHTEQCPGLMPTPRHLIGPVLAVALASGGTGCADDAPPTRVRDARVTLTLDDFSIAPQRLRARAGEVTFRAVNRGAIGHTLRVKRSDREVVAIKTLLPGASGSGSARLERGDYKLVCILGNHEELGMYGTLTVR
jgi:plastocyanin